MLLKERGRKDLFCEKCASCGSLKPTIYHSLLKTASWLLKQASYFIVNEHSLEVKFFEQCTTRSR